jgi:phosphoribosylanthranilate isomerase
MIYHLAALEPGKPQVRLAVDLGADALGFNFYRESPRYLDPADARAIIRRLPPFVTPVGVFWDHPSGHVKAVAEACGLRALQFHGDETPDDLAGYEVPVIKTLKLPPASTIEGLPEYKAGGVVQWLRYRSVATALLIDTQARWSEGEAREPIEWRLAATLPQRGVPLILSGGLTPDNVTRAITIVRPYAVDVNSGVEARPGKKDADKVRRFVAEARRAG